MRRKKKQPRQGLVDVSSLLEGALKQLGVQGDFEKHRVEKKCREVLGDKFSRALAEVRLKGRTVELGFHHSIWMNELNFRRTEMLEKLQRELPDMGIKDLKAVLARGHKTS